MIRFTVPHPPKELRANARAGWQAKKRAADAYSIEVYAAWIKAGEPGQYQIPFAKAKVTYVWKYARSAPDLGNVPGNVKALQDIICGVPRLPLQQALKYKRYHLGLVENDRDIIPEYRLEKVSSVAEECVEIIVEEA